MTHGYRGGLGWEAACPMLTGEWSLGSRSVARKNKKKPRARAPGGYKRVHLEISVKLWFR